MTGRERWLSILKRRQPDRVPMDYWTTDEAKAKLMAHLGCADEDALFQKLHIDARLFVEPDYIGPTIPADGDMYGNRFRQMDYGSGSYRECVYHPLKQYLSVSEIRSHYAWPSADWFDYTSLSRQLAGKDHRPVMVRGSEPFLIYEELRGDEQALVDLIEHPDIVHYCLDALYSFAHTRTQRILESIPGQVVCCSVAEDMGSQEDLIFSPAQIREFFLPHMRRMVKLIHDAGAAVLTHSDGAIRKIIPDLIGIGIDILNPIQWRCRGMEREALKRDFGRELVFYGGVDNQQTLPFGSVTDVRQEVIDNLRILGAGGGYILAPCHNIQAVSPAENIVAMYETGYENGWT